MRVVWAFVDYGEVKEYTMGNAPCVKTEVFSESTDSDDSNIRFGCTAWLFV